MPINRPVPCLPGVFKYGNPQNRIHLTEKALQFMRDIVKITEPGGHILDPFAGPGTTVLAVVLECSEVKARPSQEIKELRTGHRQNDEQCDPFCSPPFVPAARTDYRLRPVRIICLSS